jgi:beta-glucanase (GH16 family)
MDSFYTYIYFLLLIYLFIIHSHYETKTIYIYGNAQHTVSMDDLSPQIYAELERQGRPYHSPHKVNHHHPRHPSTNKEDDIDNSEHIQYPQQLSIYRNTKKSKTVHNLDESSKTDDGIVVDETDSTDPLESDRESSPAIKHRQWKEPRRNDFDGYEYSGEELVWFDDFEEFDLSTWQHEITLGGGGNFEFQHYTNNRTNSYVHDSVLYLRPTLTAELIGGEKNLYQGTTLDIWGGSPADMCTGNAFYGCMRIAGAEGNILNPIQSARIRTVNSFSFKYGRVEVSARLPVGDWLWPAIWLLPKYNSYGNWPASGEIDLIESRGNDESYQGGGFNTFSSALHWGPFATEDLYNKTYEVYKSPKGMNLHDDFHVYGLKWTKDYLYTYIDEDTKANRVLYVDFTTQTFWEHGQFGKRKLHNPWEGRPNAAPFDQEFYILMNVATGGLSGFFPDGVGHKPWNNSQPLAANAFYSAKHKWYPTWQGEHTALQVDWIKVYQSQSNVKAKQMRRKDSSA